MTISSFGRVTRCGNETKIIYFRHYVVTITNEVKKCDMIFLLYHQR